MKIATNQSKSLRALVLSDLHFQTEKDIKSMNFIFDIVINGHFDCIYMVGDILDATNFLKENEKLKDLFLNLIYILGSFIPIYVVYASHDQSYWHYGAEKMDSWDDDSEFSRYAFFDRIAGYPGINVLDNETKTIKKGYTISGINPSLEYATSFKDGNTDKLLEEARDYTFLSKLDREDTNTLLCHYPNAVIDLKSKTDLLDKVNLSISGHNHNGLTQFRIFPVEHVLNAIGQKNRGLVTPGKSLSFKDTKNLRGVTEFDDGTKLLINPAIKTFSHTSGFLENFNWMFYKGYSTVDYEATPDKKL